MQHMDDTITTVPDWFVKYYDSAFFWIGFAVLILLAVILIVVACRLYYQLKELDSYLNDHEDIRQRKKST